MAKMILKLTSVKGGVWQRLLDALAANVGAIVPNKKLIEVSGQHNYARRIRELRAEGWDIIYKASPGGYILRSPQKASKHVDAYINLKLRQQILERDRFTCQMCGHKANDKYKDGETVRLEVDHIQPLKRYGKTSEVNLSTLCSQCNAGKKSLLDYPETMRNRIITVNLPDKTRTQLSRLSRKHGKTVNDLILDAINRGLKRLD